MKPTAIDAFCGAGGLSLGLHRAGWDVRLAFDHDEVSIDTYRKNVSANAYVMDASEWEGSDLLDLAQLDSDEVSLLAGGPPCQGFSLQRRGDRADDRNQLVHRFMEWVLSIQPRAFIMENVPAIRSVRGRELVDALVDTTSAVGYECHTRTLNALEYGVPQRRLRTFVIGLRDPANEFAWPEPLADGPKTVGAALAGLPSPPSDGSPHPTIANHYREARLSPLNRLRIQSVPEGGNRLDLPAELELRCHANGHRHLDTYGRLSRSEPAVTLTARFDSFTRGKFGHPTEDRSITLREGARLQGFPDSYVFLGNREQGARMIGNAVPPPLAMHLGVAILRSLGQPTDASQGESH